jgi:hypothetical protein
LKCVFARNGYFSIGFGETMKNTDMATAVVDFDTLTVQIIDTWSIGHSEPILDQ